jgi:hypothetical protein
MKNTMDPAQMRKKVSRLVPTSDPLVWAAAMACRCRKGDRQIEVQFVEKNRVLGRDRGSDNNRDL